MMMMIVWMFFFECLFQHACLGIDAYLEWLIELELCDIPVQSLIGLIEYSCQQVATSFPEAGL